MRNRIAIKVVMIVIGLLLAPFAAFAQSGQSPSGGPPIQQPLIREGDFAVALVSAFNLGTTDDEVEAEDLLSSTGIAPRNGWIADYPVTPDVLSDIWQSVLDAVNSQKLSLSQDEATNAFQTAETDAGLYVRPYAAGETHEVNSSSEYPENSVINDYYYDQGPPIITYYSPPPDYYYLYTWVPDPFWWNDFWFPGFFILNDFDRVVHYHHRVRIVTNHFNDVRHHRAYRVDPFDRFHGKTYAGIGAPKRGHYIAPGVKNGASSIFNRNRVSPPPGVRSSRSRSRVRLFTAPRAGRAVVHAPVGRSGHPSEGRSFNVPSKGRSSGHSFGGRSFSMPSGGRSFGHPSGGRSSGGVERH